MTAPDTRAKELAGLLRAEVEFVKGDAAAWGADTYGDLPRTTALLNEAASLIERLYRELADRDRDIAFLVADIDYLMEATGETHDEEDAAVYAMILADLKARLASPPALAEQPQ